MEYCRLREDDFIRQAEEQGIFTHISREYIEEHLCPEVPRDAAKKVSVLDNSVEKDKKDINRVQLAKLVHIRLRGVGDLSLCLNLRICILSGNYITEFDALASCLNLIKLDLHSNQVSHVPSPEFWCRMHQLRAVHLHDNPIGAIENLHCLSNCPHLEVLTLFDTPLSLKRNYRHHTVNSIWTLKVLDKYVISDEEIIEDTAVQGKFSPFSSNFRVEFCTTAEGSDYKAELVTFHRTMAQVNSILAHFSPVHIIQRHIRGYLLRRRLNMVQEYKVRKPKVSKPQTPIQVPSLGLGSGKSSPSNTEKAALAISQLAKGWKDFGYPAIDPTGPPPPSPLSRDPTIIPTDQPQIDALNLKLDYDTYLRNRRPGSTGFSEASAASYRRPPPPNTSVGDSQSSGLDVREKSLFIHLGKLQSSTLNEGLNHAEDPNLPMEVKFRSREDVQFDEMMKLRKSARKKEKSIIRKQIKDIRQFFGPVVATDVSDEEDSEEDLPKIAFRLKGAPQDVLFYDPITDMIISKREAGMQVRAAENDFHSRKNLEPKPPKKKHQLESHRSKMIGKMQRDMGMSCLNAVHKAYEERQKAEKAAAKMEYVLRLREDREHAKERVKLFNEEKRLNTLRKREKDHKNILGILDTQDVQRSTYIKHKKDARLVSSQYQKSRRGELTFMKDFNVQNTSVSNALLRHDLQARKEDRHVEKLDKIQSYKVQEGEQQSMVRTYLEHRQLMRQTETAMSKAAIDTKMLQDANDRLIYARSRVAQQKARSAQVKASYAVPIVSNPHMDSPVLSKWKSTPVVSHSQTPS